MTEYALGEWEDGRRPMKDGKPMSDEEVLADLQRIAELEQASLLLNIAHTEASKRIAELEALLDEALGAMIGKVDPSVIRTLRAKRNGSELAQSGQKALLKEGAL